VLTAQGKQHSSGKESTDVTDSNLGLLFLEFLQFYATFDYEIRPFRPDQTIEALPYVKTNDYMSTLSIVDPLNTSNNVARATYRFIWLRVPKCIIQIEYIFTCVLLGNFNKRR
jgi:DNA polymerase sigma